MAGGTTIMKQLEESLKTYIGCFNNATTRMAMAEHITGLLKNMVPSVGPIIVKSAWDCMTLREKAKWWVCNCLIPSIGVEARKQHYFSRCSVEAESQPPPLPYWLESDPKQMLAVDIFLAPVSPAKTIVVNLTVYPTLSC